MKVIKQLAEVCPVISTTSPRPLAIGIHKQLHALVPELSNRKINEALHHYTRTPAYLRELICPGGARYNADGSISTPVTADEVKGAMERLAKLERKAAAKRPAVAKNGPARPVITLKKKRS
jgi:sRNA-binding protein